MAKSKTSTPALGRRFEWDPSQLSRNISGRALSMAKSSIPGIETSTIAVEHVDCFCGGADDELLGDRDRYGFYYPLVLCRRCGIIRASPRMPKDALGRFYGTTYRDVYGDADASFESRYEPSLEQAREFFARH
jgi:hypothetical protein